MELNLHMHLILLNNEPTVLHKLFKSELLRLHINVTMRKEHGRDIDGACGQLRAKRSGVK